MRFASLLRSLPPIPVPKVLDLGCGDARGTEAVAAHFPMASIYGIDNDLGALRKTPHAIQPILADLRALPLADRFGLILVRHPDVFRSKSAWEHVAGNIGDLLAESGVLLVTCYSIPEIDQMRAWLNGQPLSPVKVSAQLAVPDLTGRDRFALIFTRLA